jgi:RNA polymerase sigma-70 factor (ECF subfamily)
MADVAANALIPEQELVGAVRTGDFAAFTVLVDRHHAPLRRYLLRQTGDPELAADLAQETFLDAFRQHDQMDRDGSFTAWLYGIARNKVRMEYRRRQLRRFVSLDWLLEPLMPIVPGLQHLDATAACDERDAIQRALDELDPSLREALLLHSLGGCTAHEVARMLGISPPAAERRISRAKLRFRDRYRAMNMNGKDA